MASETSIHRGRGAEMFLYTGQERNTIPRDVIHVRFDPSASVTAIPDRAFFEHRKMEEVELCEGLQEIGDSAFYDCRALKRFTIPSTVIRIGEFAFAFVRSTLSIHLPDGVESIGQYTFGCGEFTYFRIPPLITTIPEGVFCRCECMFSLELPESTREIEDDAFSGCHSLRNLAIPPNAETEEDSFKSCSDLQQLFGSDAQIINALRHRFDGLPIHKMLYYQSYHPVTLDQLNEATNMRSGQRRTLRSKLDPTGKEQDCLGMTPLHILACSTQNLELYQVIVEKYPENLITKDEWGALPILYALWRNAPSEIMQFLIESYLSIYPNLELNWSKMVETLGRANAPLKVIQNLLDVKQTFFTDQPIDWGNVLENLAKPVGWDVPYPWEETFRFLVERGISKRANAIGVKCWRNDIANEIDDIQPNLQFVSHVFLANIRAKIANYETEYHTLKEATSILELALWKKRLNELSKEKKRRKKKMKMEGQALRNQCRISCGSDIVIEHVLPFLLPANES